MVPQVPKQITSQLLVKTLYFAEISTKTELATLESKVEDTGELSATQEIQMTSSPDSSICLPDSTDDLCE